MMKNRIIDLFAKNKGTILKSIYFTAGYPTLNDTKSIIELCYQNSIDFLEIGIPFSDPVADGPIIETASQKAIENGINLDLIFQQINETRLTVPVPILLMGYYNTILKYGLEKFVKNCQINQIDGVIIPDLPMEIYLQGYSKLFIESNLSFVPLINQNTQTERIQYLDQHTEGFLYLVSSQGTTGNDVDIEMQMSYFQRINKLQLKNPMVAGFGIKNKSQIDKLKKLVDGVIIGSAFIKTLENGLNSARIMEYLKELK